MAIWRVKWWYTSFNSGWSEEAYYNGGTSASTPLAAAVSLAKLRVEMNGTKDDVVLDGIGVVTVPEEPTRLEGFADQDLGPIGFYKDSPCDMPWIGIQAMMQSVGNRHRVWILRGVPDVVTRGDWDAPVLPDAWKDRFTPWRNVLLNSAWRMRILIKDGVSAPVTISNIVTNGSGQLVATSVNHGLTTGQLILAMRIKTSNACVRGYQRVITLTPDTFIIGDHNVGFTEFTSGQFRVPTYSYPAFTSIKIGRISELPTGKSRQTVKARRAGCRKG